MKQIIRKKYLNIRKNILDKNEKDEIIFNRVIKNKKILDSSLILIYVSKDDEVDTSKLINYFLKSKKVAVPKIEDNMINFYYINSLKDLTKGYFNVLEPTTKTKVMDFTNAISITPGICFSKDKYRLGYGKGFYDRFYHKNNVYKIGICYKECLLDTLPYDKYDVKVDKIITD